MHTSTRSTKRSQVSGAASAHRLAISIPHPATRFADDDACWQAVCTRDRSADRVFYYSVRTTGVYCRPSCAARLARRENVRFHPSCDAAEEAGFRACKRCQPRAGDLQSRHAASIAKACALIESAEDMPSLEAIAAVAGLSRYHFHRVFKQHMGVTPKAYASRTRGLRLAQEIHNGATITEAIYAAGFNSTARCYAQSSGLLGMRPSAFKAHGRGTVIRFAVGLCSLGSVLVAATKDGVCAIQFGDDAETLVRELQDRFKAAELIGADASFEEWVATVIGFIERPGSTMDLPLDIRGTAFQQRVWQALTKIPCGQTASYTEIATVIGQPSAVRAVALACAANPLAVAIPCHRVVRTDRALAGYRWGIERKRALLNRELEAVSP
ncbi:MAG: bifunctional DNA-binding transcriptional regulator/O6-methylguanine-DNA methyltransferase Ada [Gammaproteobacteria bacterium]|nr:bifunctional DNA-binding transcriptional regulator/O6-methylguanine-DNA methyltransferase Ada [Gammaproteobacteria bacterium]